MFIEKARLIYIVEGVCGKDYFTETFANCPNVEAFEKLFNRYVEVWGENGFKMSYTFIGYHYAKEYVANAKTNM